MPPRGPKITDRQREMILDFMEQHPELVSGKFNANFTKTTQERLWETLTNMLNAEGLGAIKDNKKWKKSWTDWKSDTKAKAANIKNSISLTGGGEKSKLELSPLETRLLLVMGGMCVEGNNDVAEGGFSIFNIETHDNLSAPKSREATLVDPSIPSCSTFGLDETSLAAKDCTTTPVAPLPTSTSTLQPQRPKSVPPNSGSNSSMFGPPLAAQSSSYMATIGTELEDNLFEIIINDNSIVNNASDKTAEQANPENENCQVPQGRDSRMNKKRKRNFRTENNEKFEMATETLKQMENEKNVILIDIKNALNERNAIEERKAKALADLTMSFGSIASSIDNLVPAINAFLAK